MALSNIFNEPRREITETVVGLLLLGLVMWADYLFGCWLQAQCGYDKDGFVNLPWEVGMVIGIALALVLLIVLVVIHAVGTGACNALERRGVHLRPRRN